MRNTKKRVFDKIAANKTSLKSQKVDLSLVDEINDNYDSFRNSYDAASYLANEYGDEVIEAYEDFKSQYNLDDYIVNGPTTDLEELGENMQGFLSNLDNKADELGIDPSELIQGYDEVSFMVENYKSLYEDAKDKYREVVEYTGMPNFWTNA